MNVNRKLRDNFNKERKKEKNSKKEGPEEGPAQAWARQQKPVQSAGGLKVLVTHCSWGSRLRVEGQRCSGFRFWGVSCFGASGFRLWRFRGSFRMFGMLGWRFWD